MPISEKIPSHETRFDPCCARAAVPYLASAGWKRQQLHLSRPGFQLSNIIDRRLSRVSPLVAKRRARDVRSKDSSATAKWCNRPVATALRPRLQICPRTRANPLHQCTKPIAKLGATGSRPAPWTLKPEASTDRIRSSRTFHNEILAGQYRLRPNAPCLCRRQDNRPSRILERDGASLLLAVDEPRRVRAFKGPAYRTYVSIGSPCSQRKASFCAWRRADRERIGHWLIGFAVEVMDRMLSRIDRRVIGSGATIRMRHMHGEQSLKRQQERNSAFHAYVPLTGSFLAVTWLASQRLKHADGFRSQKCRSREYPRRTVTFRLWLLVHVT